MVKKKNKSSSRRKAIKRPPWTVQSRADGIATFRLTSWSHFFDFLEAEVFPRSPRTNHSFVWRGQRNKDWSLSSSLDRLLERLNPLGTNTETLVRNHLDSFKYATRGRRGPASASRLDNDWWALGQHFGLATPLLDWTKSPFAAAYFAFETEAAPTDYRVVWGLDRRAVVLRSEEILNGPSLEEGQPPVIEFIEPFTDDNPRLLSQGGLFTRAPVGVPIDDWVAQQFAAAEATILLKIEIPDSDRLLCLKTLERMNINHLSLFPDLTGASRYTNLKLELEP